MVFENVNVRTAKDRPLLDRFDQIMHNRFVGNRDLGDNGEFLNRPLFYSSRDLVQHGLAIVGFTEAPRHRLWEILKHTEIFECQVFLRDTDDGFTRDLLYRIKVGKRFFPIT